MTQALPQRTVHYQGMIVDTDRWDHYEPRQDDIIVCTPPKSGTTWTQAICALLIFQDPEHGQQPGNIAPWFDAKFRTFEDVQAILNNQTHRRFIKTHTPLDGIPYAQERTYIVVHRHPLDVMVSMRNHFDNMVNEEITKGHPKETVDFLRHLIDDVPAPNAGEARALASLTHHLKSYWDFRHLPNVHLFHYADMKRDLGASMNAMADALGIDVDPALMPKLVEAAGFENMKNKADQFAPNAGNNVWKKETDFFRNGTNEQWREFMTEADIAHYNDRMTELLPADAVAWMENGSVD